MAATAGGLPWLASPMSQHDRAVMEVHSCIDNRIRFDCRIAVLQGLARLDPALRIVVTLSPSDRERIAALKDRPDRSEERRGGKECVSTCRSRWEAHH